MDEHLQSVNAALATNRAIKTLFDSLGSADHPRGGVLSAYRLARKALRDDLASGDVRGALDTLQQLKRLVLNEADQALVAAAELGLKQANRELDVHGLSNASATLDAHNLQSGARQAITSTLDAQVNAVRALVLGGQVDDSLILGDGTRVGMLAPGALTNEIARWVTALVLTSWSGAVDRSISQERPAVAEEFQRQAIAAIDERTTDCCLRVHGQVVGMDEDFRLTGTPRFADRMKGPPFHKFCRTATALVQGEHAQDDLSAEMRDAARAELKARTETGTKVEIHPASATSRRN